MDFFRSETYETWDIDPPEYPGLNAACSYVRGHDSEYGRHYKALPEHHKETVCGMMNKKYANDYTAGQFEIGKTVGNRYKIKSTLAGVGGCFNRGIFIVEDMLEKQGKGKDILKLLPTEAMNPGYAVREIDILARLNHENIVELRQGHVPEHRHGTPWLVTDFCDKKTLQDLVCTRGRKTQLVPELFAWQVSASLARAVTHCHDGDLPDSWCQWDEITHHDIILNNIFIKTNERNLSHEYPLTVKLGDWGCGVTQSEWSTANMTVDDLPAVDYDYDPPEHAVPGVATDIYQIGIVMCCLLCLRGMPGLELDRLARTKRWPGCNWNYSEEIRDLIIACINPAPDERPSASVLTAFVQQTCANLLANGRLSKEPFDFCD
jgi:serine/threonine protein kinase